MTSRIALAALLADPAIARAFAAAITRLLWKVMRSPGASQPLAFDSNALVETLPAAAFSKPRRTKG